MAVIDDKYQVSEGGLSKGIDAESIPLALDILQRGLYSFPIQSTVRELTSNAYDAIKERDVAKKIITGEEKLEDHFDVTKTEGIFHSSGFDPNYFDLNWLSDDPNVHIYYEEGDQKDVLRIVDNGVGLGGDRLTGYFSLNYSTKRTNKDSLGRFGLGSKVALSLNVDFFTVTARYNGRKYAFEVYLDKVDPITPKFSHGKENKKINLTPTCNAYYEHTTEKNGLEVSVDIKKHNKKILFEALESQLMYMPNIKVHHRPVGSLTYQDRDISAKVLYRDEDIIISESTVYDRPHVLLGTGEALISYGLVHFNELELEPKRGSVGLILDINDIEVTPSREAPIWSPKTRDAILKKYNKVTETATKLVNAKLAASVDYLDWLRNISTVLGSLSSSSNSVVGRLSSIIDVSSINNLSCPKDSSIKYFTDITAMVGHELTLRSIEYTRWSKKVNRNSIKEIGALSYPIYYTEGKADPYVDRYIYEEHGTFILVQPKQDVDPKLITDHGTKVKDMFLTSVGINQYDSVVVPEDRMDLYTSDDISEVVDDKDPVVKVASQAAKLRKQNAQIVVHTINLGYGNYTFSANTINVSDLFTLFPSNVKVVYCKSSQRDFIKSLCGNMHDNFKVEYSHSGGTWDAEPQLTYFSPNIQPVAFIIIAQENLKHVKSSPRFISLKDFMFKSLDANTGRIEFTDEIKTILTVSAIRSLTEASQHIVDKLGSYGNEVAPNLTKSMLPLTEFWFNHRFKPRSFNIESNFLRACLNQHLHQVGIVNNSTSLASVNSEIPEWLCELLDFEINEVDALFEEAITTFVDLNTKITDLKDFLICICNGWSGYSVKTENVIPHVRDYIKLKEYDAFL